MEVNIQILVVTDFDGKEHYCQSLKTKYNNNNTCCCYYY